MEHLHLPDNIKVHFASMEKCNYSNVAINIGVRYGLVTAFPFVAKRIFKKQVWPLPKMKGMTDVDKDIPKFLCDNMKHVIQDSGLYSLLFGVHSEKATKQFVYKWYDELIRFTLDHAQPLTCVEVDAQAVLGVEETWKMRERMATDLPNNRIMNVFHIEDGKYGLDRLIEFSDYLAIGSGAIPWNIPSVKCVVEYIKKKKPDIDIHLLGCTNSNIMSSVRHLCTSCDSTTWVSANRFGYIDDYHIKKIDYGKVKSLFGNELFDRVRVNNGEQTAKAAVVFGEICKRTYIKRCGNQE